MSSTPENNPTISCSSLARHFASFLARAAEGDSFTVTRYGKAVAALQAVSRADRGAAPDRTAVNAAIDEILASRKRHPLGAVSIRELINQGRRY